MTDTRSVAETMRSTLSILSIRPKDESPDERKERKKALKEYRKVMKSTGSFMNFQI